jgi:hypothetical protein
MGHREKGSQMSSVHPRRDSFFLLRSTSRHLSPYFKKYLWPRHGPMAVQLCRRSPSWELLCNGGPLVAVLLMSSEQRAVFLLRKGLFPHLWVQLVAPSARP